MKNALLDVTTGFSDRSKDLLREISFLDFVISLIFIAKYCEKHDLQAGYTYWVSADLLEQIRILTKAGHNILIWMCYILGALLVVFAIMCSILESTQKTNNILYSVADFLKEDLEHLVPICSYLFVVLYLVKRIVPWVETGYYGNMSLGLIISITLFYLFAAGTKHMDTI